MAGRRSGNGHLAQRYTCSLRSRPSHLQGDWSSIISCEFHNRHSQKVLSTNYFIFIERLPTAFFAPRPRPPKLACEHGCLGERVFGYKLRWRRHSYQNTGKLIYVLGGAVSVIRQRVYCREKTSIRFCLFVATPNVPPLFGS